jgi:hypothetical protein
LDKSDILKALGTVAVELLIYGVMVTLYAVGVLRFLADPLADLYESNLTLYAWIALALIVMQGVVLDGVTSFLLDRLRLSRFD